MKRFFPLSLILLFCASAVAQDPCRFVFAPVTGTPPRIDGVLDDACWTRSAPAGPFRDYADNSKAATPTTFFRVASDENALYLAIEADEPNTAAIPQEEGAHDAWPRGSSVEIFLHPDRDTVTYFQLATGPGGTRWDARCEGDKADREWNGEWSLAARVEKTRWAMELSIPFSSLGVSPPAPGAVWGMNLCRNREGGLANSSVWAPVGYRFHNPGKFNELIVGSFRDLWEKEQAACREKSRRFGASHRALGANAGGMRRRLAVADRFARDLFASELGAVAGSRAACAPLYGRLVSARERYRSIADELEVAEALARFGR